MPVSPSLLWLSPFLAIVLLIAGGIFLRRREAHLEGEKRRIAEKLSQVEQHHLATERELNAVLQFNRNLVQAPDDHTLVEAALSTVNELAGGLGTTFVPLDAWGQPLNAFTYGKMPEPVLRGWAEHLVSEQVRSRCEKCSILYAAPNQECPLHVGPLGVTMAIYCLPLGVGNRRLGLVNLYLAPGSSLSSQTQRFLQGLLDEMALAVETRRLQAQEINTLKHLQRLRSPRADLSQTLEALLDGVRRNLLLDFMRLRIRPMADERLSNLTVLAGDTGIPGLSQADRDCELGLQTGRPQVGACPGENDGEALAWQIFPLLLPDGPVVGTLMALRRGNEALPERHYSVLQTAAAQAAMMVENERLTMLLEYNMVIQERTRLAREIHDGLAQTLAFLKMHSAQMQTALAQGDQVRLARLLQESRTALSEAYVDTRQAIDNLRLNPDEGLMDWLEQASRGFEKATGIQVELAFQGDDLDLLPEIQAQLVRIVQEALSNIRKHARAEKVRISLRRWSDEWILEVADDGQGFEPDDVPLAAQFGLRGMRERAELIGAEFQITSQPRKGTTVHLSLPAHSQEVG